MRLRLRLRLCVLSEQTLVLFLSMKNGAGANALVVRCLRVEEQCGIRLQGWAAGNGMEKKLNGLHSLLAGWVGVWWTTFRTLTRLIYAQGRPWSGCGCWVRATQRDKAVGTILAFSFLCFSAVTGRQQAGQGRSTSPRRQASIRHPQSLEMCRVQAVPEPAQMETMTSPYIRFLPRFIIPTSDLKLDVTPGRRLHAISFWLRENFLLNNLPTPGDSFWT
ncbi:hypothetical protein B0T22DRAFT_134043 [Podospora appendiculata]|uniref:Uncharacterized protein n=1 Tax=Podospora appendiculata TaxID=314037 RepID=A0AAE0X863_9PEZI|nr:hypothetical protein B0T22DRAFT_134043 [Podospora appendiculata]